MPIGVAGQSRRSACVQSAHVRLLERPPAQTDDGHVLSRLQIGVGRAYLEESDIERALLPSELGAHVDRLLYAAVVETNASRKERHDRFVGLTREIEEAGALEKEIAFLLEEKGEPGEIDAPLIHLGFGEIGVDTDVRAQGWRHVVERIEADVARRQCVRSASARRRCDVAHCIRLDVEPQPL